jgi:hypothetical protein
MPLPIETLLRMNASPVPTQITSVAEGAMAIAPTEAASCSSKIGVQWWPPSVERKTPPDAAPK